MSDKPADTAVGTQEMAAPTTPKFSAASTPAATSQTYNEDALIEKLMGRLKPEIERNVQSTKDRRFAKLDQMAPFVDQFKGYLERNKGDYDAAVRDFKIDTAYEATQQPVMPEVPVRTAPADPSSDVQSWTTDILQAAGVDWNTDAAYQALAAKPYATPDQFKDAVMKLVAQKAKQGFTPGAASGATTSGPAKLPGEAPTKDEKRDQLTARLNELMKHPVQNGKEINKVSAELRTATTG